MFQEKKLLTDPPRLVITSTIVVLYKEREIWTRGLKVNFITNSFCSALAFKWILYLVCVLGLLQSEGSKSI